MLDPGFQKGLISDVNSNWLISAAWITVLNGISEASYWFNGGMGRARGRPGMALCGSLIKIIKKPWTQIRLQAAFPPSVSSMLALFHSWGLRRPSDYFLLLANSVLNLIRETKKEKGVMLREMQILLIECYQRMWLRFVATASIPELGIFTHQSQTLLETQDPPTRVESSPLSYHWAQSRTWALCRKTNPKGGDEGSRNQRDM